MDYIRKKFSCCFQTTPRPYVTPRRANRRIINTLKGQRDVNRWRKTRTRLSRRNAIVDGDPDIPDIFKSPVPTAPPAHLMNPN